MIDVFVEGIPYCRNKTRGYKAGMLEWNSAIEARTRDLAHIGEPCEMAVEFVLPSDKYPNDLPCGPDLDNLSKRFLDALERSILENDSLVVRLEASKRKAQENEPTGAHLRIKPARPI